MSVFLQFVGYIVCRYFLLVCSLSFHPFNRVFCRSNFKILMKCNSSIFPFMNCAFDFLKRFYLLIFRERGREGEREGEKHHVWLPLRGPPLGTWPTAQACALTGNRNSNFLVCRPMLNPLSHTTQGHKFFFFRKTQHIIRNFLGYLNISRIKLAHWPVNSFKTLLWNHTPNVAISVHTQMVC